MKVFSEDERKEILDCILMKCPDYKCSACDGIKFTLFDHLEVGNNYDFWTTVTSSFVNVPAINIVCDNCGFIGKHAIGALGLMHLYKDPFEKKESN